MSSHLISCHLISSHLMPSHLMPSHVMPCHVISCHAMSSHAMSCHAMSCHAMSCWTSSFTLLDQLAYWLSGDQYHRGQSDTVQTNKNVSLNNVFISLHQSTWCDASQRSLGSAQVQWLHATARQDRPLTETLDPASRLCTAGAHPIPAINRLGSVGIK